MSSNEEREGPGGGASEEGSQRGRKYAITTSYRDTYGGNAGTNSWRSASSSPVKEPRVEVAPATGATGAAGDWDTLATVATTEVTTTKTTATVATSNPMEDIAMLTTGQVLRHRDAMESLVASLKASRDRADDDRGDGLTTSSLIATNGGTHLMTMNLVESSDRGMRDVCAEGLVEMFRREPGALREVGSSRETVSKLLGASVREVMLGGSGGSNGSETYLELFKALVESPSEHVTKSCAEHKIVHKLVERLKKKNKAHGGSSSASETAPVLSTLQMLLDTANEYYGSSFVWNGALEVLFPMLADAADTTGTTGTNDKNDATGAGAGGQRAAIARLVASVCVGRPDSRSVVEAWVCTVEAVKGLSLLLADNAIPVDVQVLAARVLLEVSEVRAKKRDVLDAMVDYCLPRACEIIIDGEDKEQDDDGGCGGGNCDEVELVKTVAAVAANLGRDSPVAMEVIIFHANVLRRVVGVLVDSKSYDLSRTLLGAAGEYALVLDTTVA